MGSGNTSRRFARATSLLALLVALGIPSLTLAQGPVIAYVTDVAGQLQPYEEFGTGATLGGLAHRAAFLAAQRQGAADVIAVDAGDALFTDPTIASLMPEESSLTAIFIAEVYAQLGVAAVNVGERDLALGVEFLQELQDFYGFPLVSANLVTLSGDRIFPAYRIVEAGGQRVGFIGVLSPAYSSDISAATGYQAVVQQPASALRTLVRELEGQVDSIVVLSQLTASEATALARAVPQIDLILGAAEVGESWRVEQAGDVVLMQIPPQGGVVGVSDLGAGEYEAVVLDVTTTEPDPSVAEQVEAFEVELHEKCGC